MKVRELQQLHTDQKRWTVLLWVFQREFGVTSSVMLVMVSSLAKAGSKSMPVCLTQTHKTTAHDELLSWFSYRNKMILCFLSDEVHVLLQYLRDNLGHIMITWHEWCLLLLLLGGFLPLLLLLLLLRHEALCSQCVAAAPSCGWRPASVIQYGADHFPPTFNILSTQVCSRQRQYWSFISMDSRWINIYHVLYIYRVHLCRIIDYI